MARPIRLSRDYAAPRARGVPPIEALPWLLGALLGLAAWLLAADARAFDVRPRIEDPRWRLYAVEVARSEGVAASRLIAGAPSDERVDMSWYFFVAVGHGRVVLIDCSTDALADGGDERRRRAWSVTRGVRVRDALARLELRPPDVTDVVLTHRHWDHVEGLSNFRRARVHVHAREWSRVAARVRRPVERSDRLASFNGPRRQIFDGLWVTVAGRHTSHQLMVDVACHDRTVVIASDAAYLYRNVEERRPVAVSASPALNVRDVQRAVARAGRPNVLPGHDPQLFARYSVGVEGLAAVCP